MQKTKLRSICYCSILFCAIFMIAADGRAQQKLIHMPVSAAAEGKSISIEASVEPRSGRVMTMRIYYKQPEQEAFRYIDMIPDLNRWKGSIPAREVTGTHLQYFISALVAGPSILTYPETNPYNKPIEVTVTSAAETKPIEPLEQVEELPIAILEPVQEDTTEDIEPEAEEPVTAESIPAEFLILSPESGEELAAEDVVIAISLPLDETVPDTSSIKLYLDGRDVTARSDISAALVSYIPDQLKSGAHWAKLTANGPDGKALSPVVVNFNVRAGEEKAPITSEFSAHIFSDLRREKSYRKETSFAMGGVNFNGRYGMVNYSGNLFLTSLEDKKYQPRNRYDLTLATKWLGITGGDSYPLYNDLILWGKRVRGVSGYLHLGFFNIDLVYGQTYRAVEGTRKAVQDTLGNILTGVAGEDSTYIARYGTYSQKLIGIRPSIGGGRNFQLGFTFAKIKDDIGSVKYGLNPKDNVVFGPDIKFAFNRGRFILRANAAFSILTNNIATGPATTEDLKEIFGKSVNIPVSPSDFQNILIFNDSTIPIDPTKLTSLSYHISLKLNYFRNLLTIGYKSIGSEYFSLANSWLRKDIEGLYFSDRLRLFSNKLYLHFGYEDFTDNFSKMDSNPRVSLKTFNYGITFYPGGGMPHFNVSLRDHYRNNGITNLETDILNTGASIDTFTVDFREKQLYRDLSVQLGYDIRFFNLKHNFSISYLSSRNSDDYKDSRLENSYLNELSSSITMFSLATQYNLPLRTTLNYASNQSNAAANSREFGYNMFGIGAEYDLWNRKLSTFAEFRSTTMTSSSSFSQEIDYKRNHFRLGVFWHIGVQHSLIIDANIMAVSGPDLATANGNSSYNDSILRLRYDKYF